MTGTRSLRGAGLALAAVALMAACGGNGDPGAIPTATPPSTPDPVPAATPCTLPNAGTGPQQSTTQPSDVALLTDLRHDQEGCPRVVFEFDDELPAYTVEYQSGPFQECGSGDTVQTAGWGAAAFLVTEQEPAMPVDLSESPQPGYQGSYDISVGGDVLKHLREFCRFEAQMKWIIALDAQRPFTVSTLTGPSRIVIDISPS